MNDAAAPANSACQPPHDRVAEGLRGFGPLGIVAILVILLAGSDAVVPLSAILALVWARWSRTPWREIGYVRPKSWIGSLAFGVSFGIAFKFLMGQPLTNESRFVYGRLSTLNRRSRRLTAYPDTK